MNNTPRTDAAAWPETDVVEASFARQLETELNEAREQLKKTRKHLKDANRGAEINAHALKINTDRLAFATLERDAWKGKYIQQNKDLGCEMMDPNGTIWDYAKKLQTELAAVTEQLNEARDTIAMLTNTLRNNNDAARAGYEELKADLHRRYRCFVCRDTGKTDGALGFNGYGPCPLCSLSNIQDQERNYLNDLNAIHEVEKTLDENQYIEYTSFLFEICDDWRNAATATAKQRAEAYRRTIGKWEGGSDEP